MKDTPFKVFFDVRDSEVDIQGIVNHTHYPVYLAHARHRFIAEQGIDFSEYAAQGLHVVLLSCQLNFKQSLKPNDQFYVTCCLHPHSSSFKCVFYQEIRLKKDNQLMLTGTLVATCVNTQAKNRKARFLLPPALCQLKNSGSVTP